jgi:predicted phage terminase large subunit-like protein
MVPSRHHREWIRILEDVENFRWVVIVAPPGYAKSSWSSIAYSSWRIGQTGGKIRIGLVANTGELAEGFGRGVADAIESPRYEKVYGIGPGEKGKWSLARMWTSGAIDMVNPNLTCVGMQGQVVGKRFDEIILDDPTTYFQARSPAEMEAQRKFVTTTLLERFPPGFKPPDGLGRMIVVTTRWGEMDLVPLFLDRGFKIIRMPALGWWDRTARCNVCGNDRDPDIYSVLQRCEHCDTDEPAEIIYGTEPLWETMESREELEKQRELDPEDFELVKQGDPKAVSGGTTFDTGKINYAELPSRDSFEKVITFVDTSGGKDRNRGDYFVVATIGYRNNMNELWAINVFRDRMPAPEQQQKVIQIGNDLEWRPDYVAVEMKNEGIALYQNLIVNPKVKFHVRQYEAVRDKEWRAIPFANMVNNGRFFLPTNNLGERFPFCRPLVSEMAPFPNGRHDDQVDAISGGCQTVADAGPRVTVLR